MSVTSRFGTSEAVDNAPLWKYVTKMDKVGDGGGNKSFTCNYCLCAFKGSYSRVKAHLLKILNLGIKACPKVSYKHMAEMQKMSDLAKQRKKPNLVSLPPHSGSTPKEGSASTSEAVLPMKRKVPGNSPLEKAFNKQSRDKLDSLIARAFYSGGYVPPGYNSLRTTLLQKKRAHMEQLMKPIKSSWKDKGLSIVSDGWTDAQRMPLINFMGTSELGPIFLKTIDGTKEYKDRHYIARLLLDAISEVGPHKVVQVITDNAAVMKSTGSIVEAEYSHIFWTPCVVHTLNLALKNICAAKNTEKNEVTFEACHWIIEIIDDASFIRIFIMNHSMRLAIFNEFSPLKLLAVAETRFAETRFASMLIMLKRLRDIKKNLQAMVISEQWISYKEDDVGKATNVQNLILNDVWWDKVDFILKFTKPIYDMIRVANTDTPILHLVYEMWDTMIEKVKEVIFRYEGVQENETSSFFNVIYDILIDRWTKNSTPLHCLAHSLNPKYYTEQWLNASPNRVPPHRDIEISDERNKCLKRYFPNSEDKRKVNMENKEEYGKGKSKKWDIGGDTWDEPFGGAGLLSIASLSLDEPELEVVLFYNSDGGHDGDNDEEDDIVITGSSGRLFFYLNLMFI
uniref:DUF659 domain-containing protein n=1 Tax=Fagus sylvatica TaxID=28930 RepID=A0A2N9EEB5_FAGSY